jgi:hypothetical protein
MEKPSFSCSFEETRAYSNALTGSLIGLGFSLRFIDCCAPTISNAYPSALAHPSRWPLKFNVIITGFAALTKLAQKAFVGSDKPAVVIDREREIETVADRVVQPIATRARSRK